MGQLMGISPEVSLAATMRCVTIPMAIPAYDRLVAADGSEPHSALMALCAFASGFMGFTIGKTVLSSSLCGAPTAQALTRGVATGTAGHALGSATFAASE